MFSITSMPVADETAARLRARDRFAFVALRALGLRASELVGVRMRDVYALTDPKTAQTYWILKVDDEHAKGSTGRDVPMTRNAFEELMAYRSAFGLAAVPDPGEEYGLLLSTKTRPVAIDGCLVMEAKSRRYFRAWVSLTSHKMPYAIVKGRLGEVAMSLDREAAVPRQRGCATCRRTSCATPSRRL
jgi:integrase